MTALVCGNKRSFTFEDDLDLHYPSLKRHRCASSFDPKTTLILKLKQTFPLMDNQLLDKALVDCNYDVDLTIQKLQQLSLASSETHNPVDDQQQQQQQQCVQQQEHDKWVELFVGEMSSAASVDDAKARAAMVLAARDQEKGVAEIDQLKKQNIKLSQDVCVLRRLAVVLRDHLKGFEETKQEVAKLSRMLSQCQEELRMSEMNNYALKIHLNQPCSMFSMSNNLPPDVY